MKFHWFAEATYPHLADDFPAQGLSSWVNTPTSLMDPVKVGETYRMFIRLMQAGRSRRFRRTGGERTSPDPVRHDALAETCWRPAWPRPLKAPPS